MFIRKSRRDSVAHATEASAPPWRSLRETPAVLLAHASPGLSAGVIPRSGRNHRRSLAVSAFKSSVGHPSCTLYRSRRDSVAYAAEASAALSRPLREPPRRPTGTRIIRSKRRRDFAICVRNHRRSLAASAFKSSVGHPSCTLYRSRRDSVAHATEASAAPWRSLRKNNRRPSTRPRILFLQRGTSPVS